MSEVGTDSPQPTAPADLESESVNVDESFDRPSEMSVSAPGDIDIDSVEVARPAAEPVPTPGADEATHVDVDELDELDDLDTEAHGGESTITAASGDAEVATEADTDRGGAGVADLVLSDPDRLEAAIEAVLFVVENPVSAAALAAVVQQPTAAVESALDRIASRYDEPGRGIELRRVAGGVRIYTRPELSDVVEAFLMDGQRTKLSQAALETLAVIAYRQPVTRGRISAIRGVNVDGVVRTLTGRGLIVEDGADVDSGAGLYRTTSLFLEKMGMRSLDELPSLAPLLPEIDTLETDEL